MRNSEVKLVAAEEDAEAAAAAAAQEGAGGAGAGGDSGGPVENEGGNAPKRSARGKRASMILSFAIDENSGSGKDNGSGNGKDSANENGGANPNQGELRTLNADRNKLDSAMVAQLQAFQQQLDDKAAHRAKDWAQLLTASHAAKETVWGRNEEICICLLNKYYNE